MINFGDALRKGLSFSIEPKRWLPLFLVDLAFFGILIAVLYSNFDAIMTTLVERDIQPMVAQPLIGLILGFVLMGLAWYVIRIWIMGALVHQSKRPREFERSFHISLGVLHKQIAAIILVALISGILGAIPAVGWVLSLVMSLAFFFVMQGIILDRLGVVSTLKNSWKIFRQAPFDVFVAWLLIAIVSSLIGFVFALPLLIMFAGFMLTNFIGTTPPDGQALSLILMYFNDNLLQVAGAGIVALFGMEVSQVFSLKAQTEFYMQLRKRFPSIIKAFAKKVGNFF